MTTDLDLPTVPDVLDNAADIMEEWGWTQKTFMCGQGKMCEEGAVGVSSGWHVHFQYKSGIWDWATLTDPSRNVDGKTVLLSEVARYSPEYLAIRNLYSHSISALHAVGGGAGHNDRPDNTFEKSVAKLREAAEYARTHS